MQHVIIGAGPTGVVAAESIRKFDPSSTVTMVGDEPERPYSRMAIPYYLIKQIPEEGTHLRKKPEHFASHGIDVRQGRVTRLDPKADAVILQDGSRLEYERLLIATGSRPMQPPIPGMDADGVVNCWTLADARRIAAHCSKDQSIVLMGAGFIGCIILEALARSGVQLTVVEAENRMVPRMMNEISGTLIKRWCEAKGVQVRTSSRVKAIEETGGLISGIMGRKKKLRVVLENGETLDADLVISATGVRPNIEFLEGSGVESDQGILVNRQLQTRRPGVYAAGDVCQGLDFSTGGYSVQAIQPTATEHARIAGANMAGCTVSHQGSVNMNVLDTMGLISSSFGLWMGVDGGDQAELSNLEAYQYLNLQFEDDVLVGASSLGLTQHVGVLRGLIQSRTRLKDWKQKLMDDPTRIMEAYMARTQVLDSGVRAG